MVNIQLVTGGRQNPIALNLTNSFVFLPSYLFELWASSIRVSIRGLASVMTSMIGVKDAKGNLSHNKT